MEFDPEKPFNQWVRYRVAPDDPHEALRALDGCEVPVMPGPPKSFNDELWYSCIWCCRQISERAPAWKEWHDEKCGEECNTYPWVTAESVELLPPHECQRLDAEYGLEVPCY